MAGAQGLSRPWTEGRSCHHPWSIPIESMVSNSLAMRVVFSPLSGARSLLRLLVVVLLHAIAPAAAGFPAEQKNDTLICFGGGIGCVELGLAGPRRGALTIPVSVLDESAGAGARVWELPVFLFEDPWEEGSFPASRASDATRATCSANGLSGKQCSGVEEYTQTVLARLSLEGVRDALFRRARSEAAPAPPPPAAPPLALLAPTPSLLRFFVTDWGWRSPLVSPSTGQCQTVWSSELLAALLRSPHRVDDPSEADVVFLDVEEAQEINWPAHGDWAANFVRGSPDRCTSLRAAAPATDRRDAPEQQTWRRRALERPTSCGGVRDVRSHTSRAAVHGRLVLLAVQDRARGRS